MRFAVHLNRVRLHYSLLDAKQTSLLYLTLPYATLHCLQIVDNLTSGLGIDYERPISPDLAGCGIRFSCFPSLSILETASSQKSIGCWEPPSAAN